MKIASSNLSLSLPPLNLSTTISTTKPSQLIQPSTATTDQNPQFNQQPGHLPSEFSNPLPCQSPVPSSTQKVFLQYTVDLQNPFDSYYLLNNSILQIQHHIRISQDHRFLSFTLYTEDFNIIYSPPLARNIQIIEPVFRTHPPYPPTTIDNNFTPTPMKRS